MRTALIVLEEGWSGAAGGGGTRDHLSERFFSLGLDLVAHCIVKAEPELAVRQVVPLKETVEFLALVGGLEPDAGVQVREMLRKEYGVGFAVHQGLRTRLTGHFADSHSSSVLDALATVPESSLLLSNRYGPVSGFFVEVGGTYFLCLPGEPVAMESMLEEQVAPLLESMEFGKGEYRRSILLRLAGGVNQELERSISRTCDGVAGLSHSILTQEGESLVRLSARGEDEQETELILMQGRELLHERLGAAVYGLGSVTLEKTVSDCLRYTGRRLTVIDSVTGGLLPYLLARQEDSRSFLSEARVASGIAEDLIEGGIASLSRDGSLALCLLPGTDGTARLVIADSGSIVHEAGIEGTDTGDRPRYVSYMALDRLRTHLGWEGS